MVVVAVGRMWLLADRDTQIVIVDDLRWGPCCCILWVALAHHVVVEVAACTDEKVDTFAEVVDAHVNREKDADAALVVAEGHTKPGVSHGAEDVEGVAYHHHDEDADKKATVAIVAVAAVTAVRRTHSTQLECPMTDWSIPQDAAAEASPSWRIPQEEGVGIRSWESSPPHWNKVKVVAERWNAVDTRCQTAVALSGLAVETSQIASAVAAAAAASAPVGGHPPALRVAPPPSTPSRCPPPLPCSPSSSLSPAAPHQCHHSKKSGSYRCSGSSRSSCCSSPSRAIGVFAWTRPIWVPGR